MKLQMFKQLSKAKLQDSIGTVQSCLETEVGDCLTAIGDPFENISFDSSQEEFCEAVENFVEAEIRCMKECEEFSCEADAEVFMRQFSKGEEFVVQCGGIDFQATCESGDLTTNGEPSRIPQECLVDESIKQCLNQTINTDGDDCEVDLKAFEDQFACFAECSSFSCSRLGDSLDVMADNFNDTGCDRVDFEPICERIVGAADGIRVGATVVMAIGAMAIRMIN